MIDTGYQRSGKTSRVQVDGTNLRMAQYSANYRGEDLDTVNFESGGYDEGILGIIGVDWSFRGDWDAETGYNPYATIPGIYPRDDLANLRFYPSTTESSFWSFAYARVRSANNGSEVRGKVSFEASGKSQGGFNTPIVGA